MKRAEREQGLVERAVFRMLGWKIFVHSVRMVFRNRWEALRIALVPSTLIAIVTYLFFQSQTTRSANQPWTEWFGSLSSIAQIGFVLAIVANVSVIIWVFIGDCILDKPELKWVLRPIDRASKNQSSSPM